MKNKYPKLILYFIQALLLIVTIRVTGYAADGGSEITDSGESTLNFATITGIVVSASDNFPVIGANILVKGTTTGTSTDIDGSFSVEADPDDVLVISYLGFVTQEVPVGNQTSISVILVEDAFALSEVVVTGYGTRKRSHNTGAIAQVKG